MKLALVTLAAALALPTAAHADAAASATQKLTVAEPAAQAMYLQLGGMYGTENDGEYIAGTIDAGLRLGHTPVWAHAHSMGDLTPGMNMPGMSSDDRSMAGLMPVNGDSAADETVAAYGPSLSFTFTFGSPGRYLLWMQAERDYRILTVPAVLEVTR